VADVDFALGALEHEGFVLRGRFTPGVAELEWCERRLLARIHRYTLDRLRQEIEPVTAADFMRFLLRWQRVAPDARAEGPEGLGGLCRCSPIRRVSRARIRPAPCSRRSTSGAHRSSATS